MTVWFTSDLHLGHAKVAQIRWDRFSDQPGCPSIEDVTRWHDNLLTKNWANAVLRDDQVIVVGDISGGSKARQERALAMIATLPGTKFLISGNHDSTHPMHHRETTKMKKVYLEVFEDVDTVGYRHLKWEGGDVKCLISHFPYSGDREGLDNPRYMEFRLQDRGHYLIHGHTHNMTGFVDRELHVGVDAHNMQLVPLEAIVAYVKEREQVAA